MPTLGVNIDHVATIRQARKTNEPDPVWAAAAAELGGADQITIHLRQDRRHILDRDLEILVRTVGVRLNLECACVDEMLNIACTTKPHQVCLVPESRQEITTEGGLDVAGKRSVVGDSIKRLHDAGIKVSLFLDPVEAQIEAAADLGADAVEIHTGAYANAEIGENRAHELLKIREASHVVIERDLELHAGHGLTYTNVLPVARLEDMQELNIGHSIISRAVFVGLKNAVREMKDLIS